jgi:hypothetical protein
MLKLLGKLFNRDLIGPSEPIDTNVSEDEIWEILHPTDKASLSRKKKNLKKFIKFITTHLNRSETERLIRVAYKGLDDCDYAFDEYSAFLALAEIISGEGGQKRGQWVFIQIDCGGDDEIAWQASEILSLYGIEEKWTYVGSPQYSDALKGFGNLSEWLHNRGFSLVHIDTGGDWYCCFIVKISDMATVRDLARAAELKVYDHYEFTNQNI